MERSTALEVTVVTAPDCSVLVVQDFATQTETAVVSARTRRAALGGMEDYDLSMIYDLQIS